MALITNENIDNVISSNNESLKEMRILTFNDWKDEYVFADKYPNYVHDLRINCPDGNEISKRWIIVPKKRVLELLASVCKEMTESSVVNILEINETDNYKTIKDFIKYAANYKVYSSADNFSFKSAETVFFNDLNKLIIMHIPNPNYNVLMFNVLKNYSKFINKK